MTSTKREDIQWLRAMAIFAVLFFHIWPKKFPYGFLGVDIFFVISGYLMTSIITKSSHHQSLAQFYFRRIKRIFPACLIVLLIFLVIGFVTLIPTHFAFLQMEALWSILFINNFAPMFGEHLYFESVSGYKFFLHTWSLGVEIQFYLIAPFLIKFIFSNSNPFKATAVISASSAFLQLLIPSEATAFGLMFCRIWQFLVGTTAFLGSGETKYQKLENKKAPFYTKLACFALIFICFFPMNLSEGSIIPSLLRLSSTILTGFFITLNACQPISLPNSISKWLVYIGDASYVIYIIHWPLIIYFRYFVIDEYYGKFFTLFCIFLVSIFVHECLEKPMGRISMNWNLIFIGFMYLIFFFSIFCLKQSLQSDPIQDNENEFEICKGFWYNEYCTTDPEIEKYLTVRPKRHDYDRYCSFKFMNETTSKKSIMITGNSFVYFQIRGIIDAIKQSKTKFSKVYVASHLGCSLLAGTFNNVVTDWSCESIDGSHDKLLEAVKPDIIIHTSRLDHIIHQPFSPENKSDIYYKEIERTLLSLAKYTKKFIIIEPTLALEMTNDMTEYTNPLTIAHALLVKKSLNQYQIPINEYREKMDPAWNRVKEAAKKCQNCILAETEHLFCNAKKCPLVDFKTKLGRYCDFSHITPAQSLLLVPGLLKAIDD